MRAITLLPAFALLAICLGLAGCQKEGPMQKAGEKIDNTVHDATHQGPMEKAGKKADNAWDSTKQAAKDMGNAADGQKSGQ